MGLVYLKSLLYLGGMNKTVNRDMTLFTPYGMLGLADRKFIVSRTLVWCEENLPMHHSGFPPDFRFRSTPIEHWANYDSNYHTITISTTEIIDVRHLIRCVLHEWCHSVQDLSQYDRTVASEDNLYYHNHPLEKEARRYEVVWYMVWTQLKNELGSSPTLAEQLVLSWNKFYREFLGF
jgi:hypothetical protein